MWNELISKIDEMYGATLLAVIGGVAMYVNYGNGLVEMCVTGIVALLAVKAVKSNPVLVVEEE